MAHCPQGLTRLHPPKVLQTCRCYMAPGHDARLCGKDPGIEQIAREDSRCGYREQHDSLGRMSPQELKRAADRAGKVAVATEVTRLITASSTATQPQAAAVLRARLGAGIRLEQAELTPGLAATLRHAASMHNPLFYERQRMRASTYNIPRFLHAYDETFDGGLILPRGMLDTVTDLAAQAGSRLNITDERTQGTAQELTFTATLTPPQHAAATESVLVTTDIRTC